MKTTPRTKAYYLEIGRHLREGRDALVRAQILADGYGHRQRVSKLDTALRRIEQVRSALDDDFCRELYEEHPADGIRFPLYPPRVDAAPASEANHGAA